VRVVVLGAGAVGSVLGARLSVAGHAVVLVARPAHVEAVRARGLRVEGEGAGTFPLEATSDPSVARSAEAVLFTVKTFDVPSAADALGRAAEPRPTLLLQNGLGIELEATRALGRAGWRDPARWVVRAIHSIPATWESPGVVRAAGNGEIVLPELPPEDPRAGAVVLFRSLFASAGQAVVATPSMAEQIWRKAIVNAAINPVTALHGVPNGRLLAGPLRDEALALLREAVRAAGADGVPVPEAEAVAMFDRVVRSTSENRSSMLQDLDHHRPTEIDAISGEVERRARARGVDLPATRAAIAAVRSRVDRARAAPQGS
jgi:2-dehydropantoate 2-reductase